MSEGGEAVVGSTSTCHISICHCFVHGSARPTGNRKSDRIGSIIPLGTDFPQDGGADRVMKTSLNYVEDDGSSWGRPLGSGPRLAPGAKEPKLKGELG